MKFITLILSSLVATSVSAKEFNLKCVATHNADVVLETDVKLPSGAKSLSFGEFEEFEFFLSQSGENTVELQALYNVDPSRSYATATFQGEKSFVELSIWRREFIMEVRCSQVAP